MIAGEISTHSGWEQPPSRGFGLPPFGMNELYAGSAISPLTAAASSQPTAAAQLGLYALQSHWGNGVCRHRACGV